jgi:hypothetical protein
MNWRTICLSLLMIAAGIGSREGVAQIAPVGPETEVDTELYDIMDCPQIAVAPDRSFEIAWGAGNNNITDVRARHYAPDGSPTGREVAMSEESYFTDEFPDATTLAVTPISTGFRVLYSLESGDRPKTRLKFFQRQLDSSGARVPGAWGRVGTPATQWVLPGPGETVFAGRYDGSQLRLSLQQVDSLGKPAGQVYVLNTRPIIMDRMFYSRQIAGLVVTPLSDGGWVAVFGGRTPRAPGSPAQQVIRARKFNAAGLPLGPEIDVASRPVKPAVQFASLWTSNFVVAATPGGRFSIVWQEESDASGRSLRMQSFNAAGAASGPVRDLVQGKHLEGPVSMASDGAGRLLLAWFASDFRARLFNPDGTPASSPFVVPSAASSLFNQQDCGSVAWTGDSWLITWHAYFLEDISAIFLRRFR